MKLKFLNSFGFYFVLSLILTLVSIGYYALHIDLSPPKVEASNFGNNILAFSLENDTSYLLASIGLLIFGTLYYLAFFCFRNIKLKRGVTGHFGILIFLFFPSLLFVFSGYIATLEVYKVAQFKSFWEGNNIILGSRGMSIPFSAIYGDIMIPMYKEQKVCEWFLFANKPNLYIQWDEISHWRVEKKYSGHRPYYVYELEQNPSSKNLRLGKITINRIRIRNSDRKIVITAKKYLGDRLTINDAFLK